ncbi:transcriptional regulator MerR family [Brachyspira sp. CAG:484]|nr:transcriptional regulator MerR family [Brachyspira sp. CAG:484]
MALKNKFSKDKPLLTTSVVANMLGITPDRLRTYDAEKLIKTHRIKTGEVQKRLYSQYDVEWLQCLRILVKTHKMSISSIKFLLQVICENPKIRLPHNEIGEVLVEMCQNPNFKDIVRNF